MYNRKKLKLQNETETAMKKFLLIFAVTAALSANAYAAEFLDIKGHWAEDVINRLSDRGIVSGADEYTFLPESAVTRAEYLKMIMNTVGIAETECGDEGCLDAKKSDWYVGYLKSAMDKGLIPHEMLTGYKSEIVRENDTSYVKYSGSFNGGLAITREEMAFLTAGMYQYILNASTMKGLAEPDELAFSDNADISRWAQSGVKMAVANGLINGMGDGTFCPKSTTTRAQASAVLVRLIDKIG